MQRPESRHRMPRVALLAALGAALLSGCATSGALSSNAARLEQTRQAILAAEAAVMAAPDQAAPRAQLGTLHLEAGRFHSAASSLEQAADLGDTSPRIALGQALAMIGSGREGEAAALLMRRARDIPAADLGLALAMAGETEPAIEVMARATRAGQNSAALRQNLALAHALSGMWREARQIAAFDLPPEGVGARMEHWAAIATIAEPSQRLAIVLRVPVGVTDPAAPVPLAHGASGGVSLALAPVTPLAPQRAVPRRLAAVEELAPVRPVPHRRFAGRSAARW